MIKFGTDIGYGKLYCVRKNQPSPAYLSLYLFIFLSLGLKFMSHISQLLFMPASSNFIMPPTSKKLRGHIGLGLSVQSVS